jgi:hypothetical protein
MNHCSLIITKKASPREAFLLARRLKLMLMNPVNLLAGPTWVCYETVRHARRHSFIHLDGYSSFCSAARQR